MSDTRFTTERRIAIEKKIEEAFVDLCISQDSKHRPIALLSGIDRAAITCIRYYIAEIQAAYDSSEKDA